MLFLTIISHRSAQNPFMRARMPVFKSLLAENSHNVSKVSQDLALLYQKRPAAFGQSAIVIVSFDSK